MTGLASGANVIKNYEEKLTLKSFILKMVKNSHKACNI